MAQYQAVLLDLFDTVVRFDTSSLPSSGQGAGARPSTTPLLVPLVAAHVTGLHSDALDEALMAAWLRARSTPGTDETPSPRRFFWALEALGVPADLAEALAPQLADTHADAVCGCAHLPDGHLETLDALAARVRLALVSNFDHAPSCRRMLRRLDLERYFEVVVISDELGQRKPGAAPFEQALRALGITAAQALFVGDSLSDDIAGAHACGMQTVWINRKARPLPAGAARPTFEIQGLPDLRSLPGLL